MQLAALAESTLVSRPSNGDIVKYIWIFLNFYFLMILIHESH
jgi:hypothetical protein